MSKELITLAQAGIPLGNLETYIQRVNNVRILEAQEEFDLAVRYREEGDLQAAQLLVLSHLRFVVTTARTYSGYGLALADLIQEGNIGLMKAVKRFDPNVGVRLVSFAVHWIKAEIQEFVLRNWRIVKVATTKAQRKLFFNLRKAKQQLTWFRSQEINEVAEKLDVKPCQVREMETRLSAHDVSFDLPVDGDSDEEAEFMSPARFLEDHRYSPEQQLEIVNEADAKQEKLQYALATLDSRSQHIISKRWLAEPKATLQELAEHYKVSAERIRQLEQNAMKKLRTAMG